VKQIIQSYKDGRIILAEVPEPACKAGGVLVQTAASVISVGTERLMIEMGKKSLLGKARARPDLVRQAWAKSRKEGFLRVYKEAMHRLDEPIPLGYSAAGVVKETGPGVNGVQPGDAVAAAGAGYASHAEVLWVPENLCVPLPEGVDFEAGAFVMLGGIALHGVRQAGLTLGENGVVLGLGLLGQLSVQLLKAQGCRVLGIDLDRQKCELARELGADQALIPEEKNLEEAVANFTGGRGADAVIIAAASQDSRPIRLAEAVAREGARLVLVGVAELSLTREAFWKKELRFSVSRAAGPGSTAPLYEARGFDYPIAYVRWTERRNLAAFLDLMAQGKVTVDRLVTHRFPIQAGLQAYDLILQNREPHLGVVFTYPQPGAAALAAGPERTIRLRPASAVVPGNPPLVAGVIGGGRFTKTLLLPALKKVRGVQLESVATTTGATARHLAEKFGFASATTDYQEILADAGIGSVIITTRHNLHGNLALEALKAGKHVFVEKPLCLSQEELEKLTAAYDGSRLLMVGFNRRYSPLAREIKDFLSGRASPLVMLYRVNAGYIPGDSWVHDPEAGGGRLLGEVCHFIDFLLYMTGSEALRVSATAISGRTGKYRPDDNLCLTLTCRDGSVGTIIYSAQGSKAFSRERFEVFCEDSVAVLEDFRRVRLVRGGRTRRIKKLSMDLGYLHELAFFFRQAASPAPDPEIFHRAAATTRATLAAGRSLQSGKTVTL